MVMINLVKERLKMLGIETDHNDDSLLGFAVDKAGSTIKNICNLSTVPEGLNHIWIDKAAGEFLLSMKTFNPEKISVINLDAAVKSISTGDTKTDFDIGGSSSSPEQRLDSFITLLLHSGDRELTRYRKLVW